MEDLSFAVPILILTCFIPGLPEKLRRKFVVEDPLNLSEAVFKLICPLGVLHT